MDAISVAFLSLFFLILRPLVEEFWTLLQIIKSPFVARKNLKKTYGTWAAITGCTAGIGKAFAFELASHGLNIVLISRNPEKLQQLASEIEAKHNVETKIIVADFSRGREIYPRVREELEGIDVGILLNNVGIHYSYPMYFGEVPEDELWGILNVNIGSFLQMTKMLLPQMLSRKRGAIINLSSSSKMQPLPFMNLYAASKVFIDFYTEALRHEYKDSNITIQSLCPYYVCTNINHFSEALTNESILIPSAEKWVKHAISSLGIIDNTTGYWPHRFQYMMFILIPTWIKTYIGGVLYRGFRRNYLKRHPKVTIES